MLANVMRTDQVFIEIQACPSLTNSGVDTEYYKDVEKNEGGSGGASIQNVLIEYIYNIVVTI